MHLRYLIKVACHLYRTAFYRVFFSSLCVIASIPTRLAAMGMSKVLHRCRNGKDPRSVYPGAGVPFLMAAFTG